MQEIALGVITGSMAVNTFLLTAALMKYLLSGDR